MKKIPKKENFFRNLIKNKIFIENCGRLKKILKILKIVELACARLAWTMHIIFLVAAIVPIIL